MTYTVKQEGKVYDARGVAGVNLVVGTELTVVSPKLVFISGRGDCYQISAPVAGYFLAARVRVSGDTGGDTGGGTTPNGTDFTLTVEGYQPFSGTLLPK